MNNQMKDLMLNSILLQQAFNIKITPDWVSQKLDYRLAASQELSELIDHLNWKWWGKKKEINWFQIKIELVDVYCFILSDMMRSNYERFTDDLDYDVDFYPKMNVDRMAPSTQVIISEVKQLQRKLLDPYFNFELADLDYLAFCCGTSMEEIFILHALKTHLNTFRQDNGYKEGTYIQEWIGMEDNDHLDQILNDIDQFGIHIASEIEEFTMHELTRRYEIVKKCQGSENHGN